MSGSHIHYKTNDVKEEKIQSAFIEIKKAYDL